jgi:hypothetical protein
MRYFIFLTILLFASLLKAETYLEADQVLYNYYSSNYIKNAQDIANYNELTSKNFTDYLNTHTDPATIEDFARYSNIQIASIQFELYSKLITAKAAKAITTKLNNEWEEKIKSVEINKMNADVLASYANFKLFSLMFVNLFSKMSEGPKVKDMYNQVLEIDENNYLANIGLGRWHLVVPSVGGGDLSLANKHINQALAVSKNNLEKFIAYLWLSQVALKSEDLYKYQTYLEEMQSFKEFKDGNVLKSVQKLNKDGNILGTK